MTRKKAATKKRVEKETFKSIVIEFFKQHVIKSPITYLAERAGISRTHFYWVLNSAEKGVGIEKGQLDPRTACFFILQADEVLNEDEMFQATPIDNFLRPLLEKFYQENMKNDTRRKGSRAKKRSSTSRKAK